MDSERKKFLRERLSRAVAEQPELVSLRRLLCLIGGDELVAPADTDPNLRHLLRMGFMMSGPVVFRRMRGGSCHSNVARLWRKNQPTLIGLGTGYALSDDGLWRQHSWGVRREGVLETTSPRTKYFGLLLQGEEADWFAESNSVGPGDSTPH